MDRVSGRVRNVVMLGVSMGALAACSPAPQHVEFAAETSTTPTPPTSSAPMTSASADMGGPLAKGPYPASHHPALLDPSLATEVAPESFRVEFETSAGRFAMDCHRSWAPHGADRLYNLVNIGFFDDVAFFRVVMKPKPFVAQFGIHGDPRVSAAWQKKRLPPDRVMQTNAAGTVTFAMAGKPDTRTTQLFINLGDNGGLDDLGFAPVCAVADGGLEIVEQLYSGYGEAPTGEQGDMMKQGNAFLRERRPELDYVVTARVLPAADPPPLDGGSVAGGTVADASAVVGAMAPGFRRCYAAGLAEDPSMKGTVRVTAKIGVRGAVESTSATSTGTLSPGVVACIRSRVASATFSPPEGGAATLVVPVTLSP